MVVLRMFSYSLLHQFSTITHLMLGFKLKNDLFPLLPECFICVPTCAGLQVLVFKYQPGVFLHGVSMFSLSIHGIFPCSLHVRLTRISKFPLGVVVCMLS